MHFTFVIRFNCLNIAKCDIIVFATYTGTVDKECERFKILSFTDAQFKCLIFVCGLRSAGDAEVRTRILSKIEQNQNITLEQVTLECQRLVNLKLDSHMVQQSLSATTAAVNSVKKQQNPTSQRSMHKKSPSACWNCGGWHFAQKCLFKIYRSRVSKK